MLKYSDKKIEKQKPDSNQYICSLIKRNNCISDNNKT